MNELSEGNEEHNSEAGERRRFLAKALGILAGTAVFGGLVKAMAQTSRKSVTSAGDIKSVQDTTPYLGEILMFAGNFAPTGWALCNGQLLSISQNTALFSILGTFYGGDGRTTFALPNLQGRFPIGTGSGLSTYVTGQIGGAETHTLTVTEMPTHSHPMVADNGNGTSATPIGNVPAINSEGIQHYGATLDGAMNPGVIGNTGGGQPFSVMPPYVAISYIIALQGVFPSRS